VLLVLLVLLAMLIPEPVEMEAQRAEAVTLLAVLWTVALPNLVQAEKRPLVATQRLTIRRLVPRKVSARQQSEG
jgi:hypothetical protein